MIKVFNILLAYFQTKVLRKFSDRKKLEAFQQRKLRKHLMWVSKHSPYFKGKTKLEDYNVMTKQGMMDNFSKINTKSIDKDQAMEIAIKSEETRDFSPMIGDISVGLSSGTSGNRGMFLAGEQESARWAGIILAKLLPGTLLNKYNIALFLRANNNLYETLGSKKIKFKFFDLLTPVAESALDLNNFNPTILVAPPSLLRLLAKKQEEGIINITPQRIFSAAEVLDPIDEQKLEKVFSQKIHQIYQCTEGFLAHTCDHGTIHLNEDFVIIEKNYINTEKTKFHPVITDLERKTQPIIRYELNDILTLSETKCPCGSASMAISQIEGRADDIFYFKDQSGELCEMFPDFIRRKIIMASSEVDEYKIVQKSPTELEIYLNNSDEIKNKIKRTLFEFFDEQGFQESRIFFKKYEYIQSLTKLKRVERAYPIDL